MLVLCGFVRFLFFHGLAFLAVLIIVKLSSETPDPDHVTKLILNIGAISMFFLAQQNNRFSRPS